MRHPLHVDKYDGDLESLAKDIANMRYDKVAEFVSHLNRDLYRQSNGDFKRNRPVLAKRLLLVVNHLRAASAELRKVWMICEKYMDD